MASPGGGSSAPSYNHIVANKNKETDLHHFKKPTEGITEDNNTEKIKTHKQRANHEEDSREKRKEGSSQKDAPLRATGGCKPKSTITPWVVLSDPVLQVHRDHMTEHAIICKFMGMANGEGLTGMDKVPLETERRNKPSPWIQGFLHNGVHELRR